VQAVAATCALSLQRSSRTQVSLALHAGVSLGTYPAAPGVTVDPHLCQSVVAALCQPLQLVLLRRHCCECQQVTGKAGHSSLSVTDPYGIRIALRKGHPLSLLTWQEYLAVIQRAAAACEQLLPGQALQQLMAFSREQRNLVRACRGCGTCRGKLMAFMGSLQSMMEVKCVKLVWKLSVVPPHQCCAVL
jgi:hypothetical protein